MKLHRILTGSIAALLTATPIAAHAQAISINSTSTLNQNFDTLGTASAAWTDNSTLAGWYAEINDALTADGTLQVSDGSAVLSGLLNLGSIALPGDRALGSRTTGGGGNANIAYGVLFQNTSTGAITITNIGYTAELWRSNDTVTAEQWFTYFQKSSTPITDLDSGANAGAPLAGAFTALPALNWTSPIASKP